MVDFGKRLRALRNNAGLTQEQLSKKLRLTKSVISAYENDIRMPSYDVLVALSRIFRVSTDYLLGASKQEADAISSESISVDLSGLSDDEIFAIKQLVRVIQEQKKTPK